MPPLALRASLTCIVRAVSAQTTLCARYPAEFELRVESSRHILRRLLEVAGENEAPSPTSKFGTGFRASARLNVTTSHNGPHGMAETAVLHATC